MPRRYRAGPSRVHQNSQSRGNRVVHADPRIEQPYVRAADRSRAVEGKSFEYPWDAHQTEEVFLIAKPEVYQDPVASRRTARHAVPRAPGQSQLSIEPDSPQTKQSDDHERTTATPMDSAYFIAKTATDSSHAFLERDALNRAAGGSDAPFHHHVE